MPSVTWQLATVMTSAAGVSSTWAHWPGLSGLFRWDMGEKGQNEAGQSLTKFCQENTLVIASTLFHKREIYTWT